MATASLLLETSPPPQELLLINRTRPQQIYLRFICYIITFFIFLIVFARIQINKRFYDYRLVIFLAIVA